jgi:hypothetical protein
VRKLEVIGLDLIRKMFKPKNYSNIKTINYDIEIAKIFETKTSQEIIEALEHGGKIIYQENVNE